MIYSEKTSKWVGMRYLFILPLAAIISLLAACTETPTEAVQEEIAEVLKQAEVMPEFPGGMQELFSYMGASVKYPESAKVDGVEGKVFVQFVVDTKGKITETKVLRGVSEVLDAEALRVVSEMPDWTPGKQDGKAVNVEMVLPIAYKLE